MESAQAEKFQVKNLYLSKALFFLKRISIYCVFLFFPYWTHLVRETTFEIILLSFLPYFIFLLWQWNLVAKECEYRLKIYTRSNSSMDRLLSRVLLGSAVSCLYCAFLSMLPNSLVQYIYWTVWIAWGGWISWPTRKKVIESKISNEFSEFRFLDGFEKTVLLIFVGTFVVSLPQLPFFNGLDATKLYIDPAERVHIQFWNFIEMCYLPFGLPTKFKNTYIYLHFYFYFFSFTFLGAYSFLRYVFSRRLSLLGIFAFISTWSFSLLIEDQFSDIFYTTIPIVWLWGILWVVKSHSYRSGFMLGFLNYWLVLIDYGFIYLIPLQVILVALFLREVKTRWYIKQLLRYTALGNFLALVSAFTHHNLEMSFSFIQPGLFFEEILSLVTRKSFFTLSFIGVIVLVAGSLFQNVYKDKIKTLEAKSILISWVSFYFVAFFINYSWTLGFNSVFLLVILSLVPLDLLFERLNRLRSRRNLIFLIYIMICLLDSHLEGRVKILWENFKNL